MPDKSFNFSVKPWSIVRENKEYSTPIFNLLKRELRLDLPDETLAGDFYILDAPAWINVMAFTPDDEIILVEQYRHGIQKPTLEIPGGMVDAGESPIDGAKRELLEETGYRSEKWDSLGKASANPAIMNNFTHMYVAKDCEFAGAENPDQHERIEVHKMPLNDFLSYVEDGTIHHAIVLAAVARFLLRGKT
jgi:8-oxo-dGTP pyrophosphatase MutT (NUDIX family)